ncbi:hypothetical protein ACIBO2_10155 [Nonomuraea sp. NPDC050022]|uniref:hypothetical protein n=1 Tax=Nonomuraea sp. NPDC050022 TaxID=3364358 RepID=UPI0037BB50E5
MDQGGGDGGGPRPSDGSDNGKRLSGSPRPGNSPNNSERLSGSPRPGNSPNNGKRLSGSSRPGDGPGSSERLGGGDGRVWRGPGRHSAAARRPARHPAQAGRPARRRSRAEVLGAEPHLAVQHDRLRQGDPALRAEPVEQRFMRRVAGDVQNEVRAVEQGQQPLLAEVGEEVPLDLLVRGTPTALDPFDAQVLQARHLHQT